MQCRSRMDSRWGVIDCFIALPNSYIKDRSMADSQWGKSALYQILYIGSNHCIGAACFKWIIESFMDLVSFHSLGSGDAMKFVYAKSKMSNICY